MPKSFPDISLFRLKLSNYQLQVRTRHGGRETGRWQRCCHPFRVNTQWINLRWQECKHLTPNSRDFIYNLTFASWFISIIYFRRLNNIIIRYRQARFAQLKCRNMLYGIFWESMTYGRSCIFLQKSVSRIWSICCKAVLLHPLSREKRRWVEILKRS